MQALAVELRERAGQVAAGGDLVRLASHLEHHLHPLAGGPVYLPTEKAMLSRDGGRCARDGARLAFAPQEPDVHRCPRCGTTFSGPRHHRAWITRYHIWLAERAVHGALIAALGRGSRWAEWSADTLAAYASRYRSYPNADNVLGPTRLFFSTYLESIWLTQVTTAAAILDVVRPVTWTGGVQESVRAMVGESAEIVRSFDEGFSNRQVWNAGALAAAGAWLDDESLVAAGVDAPSGIRRLLTGVDADGFWHEGENYHLFALKGFVLAAEWVRWANRGNLYAASRLGAMYAAPLATLLPDLTVPARGDSPYGVSVRQLRFADLWEVGRARTADPRLDAVLHRLYAEDGPEGEDVGFVELAEQEEHRPPARQRRDRLGWKALLWMRPDPPRSAGGLDHPATTHLPSHGIVILRPAPDAFIGVECGTTRRGHAHPDLLHLTIHLDGPLLADYGTGSYVSRSLFWYRSTLAHNAPGVAGTGQQPVGAWCEALDASGDWAWCRIVARDLFGPGTSAVRSVIATRHLAIDLVDVDVPDSAAVDLPIHPVGVLALTGRGVGDELSPVGHAGAETGYDHLEEVSRVDLDGPLTLRRGEREMAMHLVPRAGEQVFAASAPGPPGADFADGVPCAFLVRRANGTGQWICVHDGGLGGVTGVVAEADGLTIHTATDSLRVAVQPDGATIVGAGGTVRLAGGMAPPHVAAASSAVDHVLPVAVPRLHEPPTLEGLDRSVAFALGARHYRRSESAYGSAGPFSAHLRVAIYERCVVFQVDVTKDDLVVRHPDAPDPALDNEPAEIHSDGVQCYVGVDAWSGCVVLPDLETGGIRARAVAGTSGDAAAVSGNCRRTQTGYRLVISYDTGHHLEPGRQFRFTVTVNEMRRGRERRAGQLALAGGGWAYLRGDREAAATAVLATVQ